MLILLLSFAIEVEVDDEDEVRSLSTPHGLEMKVSDSKDGLDSLYSYCKPDSMTSSIVKSLEEDALYPFAYASIFLLQVLIGLEFLNNFDELLNSTFDCRIFFFFLGRTMVYESETQLGRACTRLNW